eukprot:SAG31_NODE_1071_length_10069_cov_3.085356_5_plen_140_part_00
MYLGTALVQLYMCHTYAVGSVHCGGIHFSEMAPPRKMESNLPSYDCHTPYAVFHFARSCMVDRAGRLLDLAVCTATPASMQRARGGGSGGGRGGGKRGRGRGPGCTGGWTARSRMAHDASAPIATEDSRRPWLSDMGRG